MGPGTFVDMLAGFHRRLLEDDGHWEVTIRNDDVKYEVDLSASFEFVAVDYD